MTVWIIEPRDPLIVRDTRPFGPNPGARSNTLDFPFPSTLVGALRTRAGTENGEFNKDRIDELLKATMRGPLLVELDQQDQIAHYYLPAPADALIYTNSDAQEVRRVWLSPQEFINSFTNKFEGESSEQLCYISAKESIKGKAYSEAPSFWNAADFAQWLVQPKDSLLDIKSQEPYIKKLPKESRMHVSIDKDTQTSEDGMLYLTSGLEFVRVEEQEDEGFHKRFHRLALAVDFSQDTKHFIGGLSPLGGERRLMHWYKNTSNLHPFHPDLRNNMIKQIQDDKRCRVILLTPAYFQAGYRPNLQWKFGGVTATLKGVVNPRYQTVSGWDFALNRPKAFHRLAPAGSVYFVEFAAEMCCKQIQKWCEAVWLQNVSDDEQWRRDGFGLAVLGTWEKEQ
jgi:CRISPR-associated protein Cmr3